MLVQTFEELEAWKAAHALVLAVYAASRNFPREETFGITSQLRRCATSIPANLAEGFGRRSRKELLRYANIADGSLQETKYFLLLARDLKYVQDDEYDQLKQQTSRVGSLLGGLQRSLRNGNKPSVG
jgi:four helix bundle protein